MILKEAISGAAAWKGSDLQNDDSWIYHLSAAAVTEIEQALQTVVDRGLSFPEFGVQHFAIPTLRDQLAKLGTELETGRGFILLRGLPIERYSDDEVNIIYYGLGLNMGLPVRQNPKGDLLGVVMNVGDLKNKNTRVYETNAYLPYHTDPSDVFGLLCVRPAKSGGLSSLVSAASVYNEILRLSPEFLALFYRPFYYAHLGRNEPGLSPIFSYHNGRLSCRYLRQYIELGHDVMGLPLSRVEIAALDLFDSITHREDMRLDMMLQPGDMQFANNYAVLHSRNGFEDHENSQQHRKLLRLWLKMSDARTLAPDFPGRNGFGAPEAVGS